MKIGMTMNVERKQNRNVRENLLCDCDVSKNEVKGNSRIFKLHSLEYNTDNLDS
jgi:hypothetical protein